MIRALALMLALMLYTLGVIAALIWLSTVV